MKIYVISLERSRDRRASICSQLDRIGASYEIIDAVDGSILTESELSQIADSQARAQNPRWLNSSAIACAQSHLVCYQKILELGVARALILEDDMIIENRLFDLLSSVDQLEVNPHSVTLLYYRSEPGKTAKLKVIQNQITSSGLALVTPCSIEDVPICAGAYVVTREACQALCKNNSPIVVAADSWKFFLGNGTLQSVYAIWPRVCSGATFDSTISYAESYYHPVLYMIRVLIGRLPIGLLKRYRRRQIEKSMSSFEIVY